MGNRLFLGAHLVAFSEHFQVPVLNLAMAEYTSLFPWMEGNAGFAYPWAATGDRRDADHARQRCRLLAALPWSRRFRYWGPEDYHFDGPAGFPELEALRRGKSVYFSSWLFRGFEAVRRHREAILEVFRFSPALVGQVTEWMEEMKAGVDCLVGVHVRWEDYRGTTFFLDQPAFRSRMEAFRSLHPDKKVRFLLFSNEALPRDGWGDLDLRLSPGKTPEFDMSAMSSCDYLMAPPSTFSGWASYSGRVPLLTLSQGEPTMGLKDFRVVEG